MIFYFSATGNTKWAAEQLAAATGEQLYSISELIRADHCVFHLQETERIGFCFPVHGWRPPMPVCDFLTRIKIANATGHFCFALCTAGDTIGETMRILQQDLAVAGLHAEGLYSLLMPNTYVGLPFMTVDSKETAHRKLKVAAEEISRYVTDIVNRRAGSRLHVGRWPRINSRWLGEWFIRNALTDRPFRVNNERCIRCGRCAPCVLCRISREVRERSPFGITQMIAFPVSPVIMVAPFMPLIMVIEPERKGNIIMGVRIKLRKP